MALITMEDNMRHNNLLLFVLFVLVTLMVACQPNPDQSGAGNTDSGDGNVSATSTPVVVVETTPVTAVTEVPSVALGACEFDAPASDLDTMSKTLIELATPATWFHRVFNQRLFNAANNWGGADSWFVTLALGPNAGGNWTSMSNPGQVVYRATSTNIQWCLGVLTTSKWKNQFMGDDALPAAINIRIAPESVITVVTNSGKVIRQATSDMGDITIVLPDSGIVTISVSYTTAAPTHESLVWWGPYDRSVNINTLDAR